MLGRLGKKKKRNRKNKCGSQKKDEDWWFLEVPRRCLEIAAKIDAIPVGQEEEKKQEWEDWWFDPEIEAKTNKIPVGQGYHIRGRFGDHIYVRRTVQDGCSLIGESPTKAVSCSVLYGAKFLSKTIKIAPDGFHSRLDRRCNDETKIIVKGKDSVCGVSRRNYKGGCLEATTFASAAPFCYGEKHGFPLDSDNYEEMMMPFSRVTFSLDTTVKEGCKDNEYTDSKGCEDYLIEKNIEPLCDKDLAAQFNEQKAINYLENKLKQDPVIGHDETIEEEKKQEWEEEEKGEKMLGRSGKKKKRNRKNKCGSQKRDKDRWFQEVPTRFGPEIKAEIDEIPVVQGYHMRGRRGQHIYVTKTQRAGCWKTVGVPESPPKAVSWFVNYGANFLSKTIEIDPEGSHSTLVRCCADETKIIVKGKDSVCGVSVRSYQDGALEALTLASAAPFFFGEEHGFPLESDDYEEMMKPFSRVTFSLDTDKEGCKDDEYIESKGREDTLIEENMEPLCDEVYVIGKELWIEKALSVEEIEEFLSR